MTTAEWKALDLQDAYALGYITEARYRAMNNREVPGISGRRKVVNMETAAKHPLWAQAEKGGWIGQFNDQGYEEERQYMLREAITDMMQMAVSANGGLRAIAEAQIRHMVEVWPEPLDFVFGGFLAGTVGILTAPGATGKSFFALELAVDIASGADILGLGPKNGGVTYLALEDVMPVLHHRLHDIGKHVQPAHREALYRHLHLMPCVGTRVDVEAEADFIIEQCCGQRLIVVDTLSRAHAYEENSNSEMARLMVTLDRIANKSGAAVLFLHHVAKGAMVSSQHAARGASAITDNARWAGFVEKLGDEKAGEYSINGIPLNPEDAWRYVRFNESKVNYGPNDADYWYERAKDTGVLLPAIGFERVTAKRQEDGVGAGWRKGKGKTDPKNESSYDYYALKNGGDDNHAWNHGGNF